MTFKFNTMLEKLLKNPFFHDALSLNLLGVSFILNLISWTLLLWFIEPREMITLHYNVSVGIDLTGSWQMIFIIPLLGILVILANTILAALIYKKNRLLSWLLSAASFMAQIIIIVSAILLILANTRFK